MKSVRIQPDVGDVLLVDIVCDCGQNGLRNIETSEVSFTHPILMRALVDTKLKCDGCGAQYTLHPQQNHIHVNQN